MALISEQSDQQTVDNMCKYNFTGSPTSLYEHVPVVGERRVMTVTVECTMEGHDQVKEGERQVARWKVVEAAIGRWKVVEAAIGREVEPEPEPEPDPTLDDALSDNDNEDYGDDDLDDGEVGTPEFSG